MRILAIDTVTEMCSVALSVDGNVLERQEKAVNQHSNIVLGMVSSLLEEAGISLRQLDLVINDVGPGSFTGIRIGMGVAQGLAYGAELPVLAVDALSSLAWEAGEESSTDIIAAIDARMGQLYWAHYIRQGGELILNGDLHLSDPQQLSVSDRPVYGIGSGWDAYPELMEKNARVAGYAQGRFPLARYGLALGMLKTSDEWVSAGQLVPVYLRNDVAKVGRKNPLLNKV